MLGLTFCKQTSSGSRSASVSSIGISEEMSNEDLNQYFDFFRYQEDQDRKILENAELEHDRPAQDSGGKPRFKFEFPFFASVDMIVQENMDSWYKMPPFTDPFALDIGRVEEGSYDSPYVTKDLNGIFESPTKYSALSKEDYYEDTIFSMFSSPQIQSSLSPKPFLRGGDRFDAVSGRSTEMTPTSAETLKSKSNFPPSLLDPRKVPRKTGSTLESGMLAQM
jgi:hypothetical protein